MREGDGDLWEETEEHCELGLNYKSRTRCGCVTYSVSTLYPTQHRPASRKLPSVKYEMKAQMVCTCEWQELSFWPVAFRNFLVASSWLRTYCIVGIFSRFKILYSLRLSSVLIFLKFSLPLHIQCKAYKCFHLLQQSTSDPSLCARAACPALPAAGHALAMRVA